MPDVLQNLPPLTPAQANAIDAWLHAPDSMGEAAAYARISLAIFLDHLAHPDVQTHLRHARRMTQDRADQRLAEAARIATQVLEIIAANPDNDPTERRRAATTILRAHRPPQSRPRRRHPDFDRLTREQNQIQSRSSDASSSHSTAAPREAISSRPTERLAAAPTPGRHQRPPDTTAPPIGDHTPAPDLTSATPTSRPRARNVEPPANPDSAAVTASSGWP